MLSSEQPGERGVALPECGFCAHRGAHDTAPENTLYGIQEAVDLRAPMIEIDLRLSRDGVLVLMHDETVDRTTNGQGRVADLSLEELKRLDAGGWKEAEFAGARVPTFREALACIPEGIWINCHIKGGEQIGRCAAEELAAAGRLKEAFLAAELAAVQAARAVAPDVLICYMERIGSSEQYVEDGIAHGAEFLQFTRKFPPALALSERLRAAGVRSNYFYAETREEAQGARLAGVDFILVNDLAQFMAMS